MKRYDLRISAMILAVLMMVSLAGYSQTQVEVTATSGTQGPTNYSTLKGAFDAINSGTHKGGIVIKITASTTETATAALNASAAVSTSAPYYTSISIYPTNSGLSVTGNLAAPLINLNGADNVTIDGRVNATGNTKDLTISNTSSSSAAATSTIRFIADASSNMVRYCTIKGSSIATSGGIVFFSTGTSTGNDNNTIDNNDITNAADASRPLNSLYALGSSAYNNDGNKISNNNFFDFLSRGTASYGINISSYNSAFTISGNSFYESASFTASAAVNYNVIMINAATGSGNGFTVTGNYIGGSAAQCGGSAWTKTVQNNAFTAISVTTATGTANSIHGNTIGNINWTNEGISDFTGISVSGATVANIGTITGNTIGAATGLGSITFTSTTTATDFYGISIASSDVVDCRFNSIGSITVANASTNATNFYGIVKTGTTGNTTISNNIIGSTSTESSINASSGSTSNAQSVYGIQSAGTGSVTISGNMVANLTNASTNTTPGSAGLISGIYVSAGTNTISDNNVHDLSNANANSSLTGMASVTGIVVAVTSLAQTVSGNRVYNLSNSNTGFSGGVIGIYYSGPTSPTTSTISRNFIYSLSVSTSSTTADLYGIKIDAGTATYSNNIVSLGGNTGTDVFGIYQTGASGTNNLYFNTVYISGDLASGTTNTSYALYSTATTNTRDFRNNILVNVRSTTGGSSLHYALYIAASGGTLNCNFNNYYVSGMGSVLGYFGANKTSLPIVSSQTGNDANSITTNPAFIGTGNTAGDYTPTVLGTGVTGTGITVDYTGSTRAASLSMGAIEVSGTPPLISSFSPASAKPGEAVILSGYRFNTTAANNIVFFGATRGTVTASTATSVTVTVPVGATNAPITLLNTGTVLACASLSKFNPVYSPQKSAIAPGDFSTKVDFTTGTSPRSVAIGDLDGDGKADLAVANNGSSTVSVFRNTSTSGRNTSSSFAAKVDLTTGASPNSVAIGDLDGDGKLELVVVNGGSGANSISVFRNNSTSGSITSSSFDAKVDYTTGTGPYSVAIGDLDGDGKPDLAVANTSSNTVSVLRNTSTSGTVSFAAKVDVSTGTGSSPTAVAIGDLDGDGKADLAVGNGGSVAYTVSVFRNTSTSGTVSFAAQVDFSMGTGSKPYSVAIGDLDGDGKADMAVVNYGSNTVSVLRNISASGSISTGSFATKVDYTTGTSPYFVAIGDLDGDGKADLAVTNGGSNSISVFRNTSAIGTVSFAGKVDFTTGLFPNSVAIGDLDGDSRPDLAVANINSHTVSVLRNADYPPVITNFSPTSAKTGDEVTLTGTGFNTTAANNIVFFGATRGAVTAASSTSVTVTVPVGASYAPITLLNTTVTLTGASPKNFNPVYDPPKSSITVRDFSPKLDFTVGTNPYSVAIGDLDGDGKADLAVANLNSNTVSVYRNTSTSGRITSSSFAAKVDFTTGTSPFSVAIGDLDGDGKADLAVANANSTSVSIFRNTSEIGTITSSSFAAKVDFTTGPSPYSVAIGDLDGDGKADLVVANSSNGTGGNSVSVLRNTSEIGSITSSSFAAKVNFTTGTSPYSVAIGDLDGDGKIDLAVTNMGSGTVSVLRNTSEIGRITSSSFAAKVDFTTGTSPYSVAVGDLDGDGKSDLAVANGGSGVNSVSVFRNTSTSGTITSSSFDAKVDYTTGTSPYSAAIGDLDGDGKADLAVANYGSNSVSVLRNISTSGTVSLATKVDFTTGSFPYSVAIGDLDGDGRPDLAVANVTSNSVSVLRNADYPPVITTFSPTSAKPGDAVTLTGTGFNSTAANNIVFFGATRGTVTAAMATSITVTVPVGATYAPITLLNTAVALTGASLSNFNPVYDPPKSTITTRDFPAKVDFTAGTSPYYVATGDLDGDGKSDMVVANNSSNTVSIFRNTSVSGSIDATSLAFNVELTTGSGPRSVAIGDLDGDGKADLAVVNGGVGANSVSVFRNISTSGTVSFAAKVDFTTNTSPSSVAIGDLDGDGKTDMAVVNYGSNNVSVFRNNSEIGSITSTSFAARVNFTTGINPSSVAIGDVDGDGKSDLAVVNYGSNTVSVFRNNSTSGSIISGSFVSKVDFATGTGPNSIAIGDLDGDGKADLAVANYSSNSVSVIRNNSTSGSIVSGSFATKVDFTTGTSPTSVVIGDLDGDSRPDLALANNSSGVNTVSVLRNTSISGSITSGSFAGKVDFTTEAQPRSVAVGDLDGDGRADLAVANYNSNSVSILRNESCLYPTSGGFIAEAQSGIMPFDPAAFTSSDAASGNYGTLEYKWQYSTTSSNAGFSDVSSSNTANYNAGELTQTTWFKRLARVTCQTDWTGAAESNVLEVTVYSSFTWNGSTSNDWNTPSNWTPSYVPSAGASVIIPTGLTNYPVTPPTTTLSSLTVQGGSLAMGSSVLTLTGNLTNNGTITSTTGKLIMAGSSVQTISGTGTINNLEINNSAGVTITAGTGNMQSLSGMLTPTAGTLITNGNLTLKSSSSGTARVAEHSTSGSVSGSVTVERWIDLQGRPKQWRTLGFPFSGNMTLGHVSGFAVDYTPTSLSVMYYNEGGDDGRYGSGTGGRNAGYVSVTGETVPIPAGRGVMAWIYGPTGTVGTSGPGTMTGNITVSYTGSLNENIDAVTLPVSFSSDNTNKGWNLVSNPFASPIDWSHASITKTNINNAIYRWDPASASWTVWSAGTSTPSGMNAIVESGGAFFVKASAASPSLIIPQTAKTHSSSNFAHFGRAPERLELPQERVRMGNAVRLAGVRLSVSGQGNPLPNEAYLDLSRPDATGHFEGSYDAESMGRSSGAGVSIRDGRGTNYAIQFDAPIREAGVENRYYPIHVTSPSKGSTTLELRTEGAWNPLNSVSLIDRKEGKTLLLKEGRLVYPFTMDDLKSADRFQLAINHVKVDRDGAQPGFNIQLLGNPVTTERIDLLVTHPTARPRRWELASLQGAKMVEGRFELTEGNVQYRLQTPGIQTSGVYVLKVELDNGEMQQVQVMRK